MKHERMKVLELLEAGKITAEEATQLLGAMKKPDAAQGNFFDEDSREQIEEKISRFTSHVDKFTREFGGKVESVYKEFEPKIKKASHVVLEKTAAIFDEISRSLNESLENARKAAEGDEKEFCGCGCDEPGCDCDDNTPKEN